MPGIARLTRIFAPVLACCGFLPSFSVAADLPLSGAPADSAQCCRRVEQRFQVPDAILTDPWGKSFSLAQELAADGPVVLNFISTGDCGESCNRATRTFADLQTRKGPRLRELRMISIATNPRQDTPSRLRLYAKENGIGSRWMVLTGSRRELVPVLQAFNASTGDDEATFYHAGPKAAWVRIEGPVSAADLVAELH